MPLTPDQQLFYETFLAKGKASRMSGQHQLLEGLAAITVPEDASPEEAAAITRTLKRARSLLDDSTTDKELMQAKIEMDAAQALAHQAAQRVAEARLIVQSLKQTVQGLIDVLDPDTPPLVAAAFTEKANGLAQRLIGAPTGDDLTALREEVEQLDEEAASIAEDVRIAKEEQIKRNESARQLVEGVKQVASQMDAEALTAHREEIAKLVTEIEEALPEPVSVEALARAVELHRTFLEKKDEIATDLTALREVRQSARTLLKRLDPTAPGLAPHPRATEAERKPILDDAAKLVLDAAQFDDLEAIHTKGLVADALEPPIVEIERRMVELSTAIEKVIADVKTAVDAALQIITAPKGRALSAAQERAFGDLITAETDKTDLDLSAAPEVIKNVTATGALINKLSLSLAGYEKRINAVAKPDIALLSVREKSALAAREQEARDALDEVTEL